jgi:hypothetical protein
LVWIFPFSKKRPKTAKKKGYSLNFLSVFGNFFLFRKSDQKRQKSKAIAFTFRPFLATSIFEKAAKNRKKVRLYGLHFSSVFVYFFIFEKAAKNGKK